MKAFARRSRLAGNEAASIESSMGSGHDHSMRGIAAWRRRHDAARRLLSLDCGCLDPWPCRCTEPPLSPATVDGWRKAALHLLEAGLVPPVPVEVLQKLWRTGGSDRELAELVHKLNGGEIA